MEDNNKKNISQQNKSSENEQFFIILEDKNNAHEGQLQDGNEIFQNDNINQSINPINYLYQDQQNFNNNCYDLFENNIFEVLDLSKENKNIEMDLKNKNEIKISRNIPIQQQPNQQILQSLNEPNFYENDLNVIQENPLFAFKQGTENNAFNNNVSKQQLQQSKQACEKIIQQKIQKINNQLKQPANDLINKMNRQQIKKMCKPNDPNQMDNYRIPQNNYEFIQQIQQQDQMQKDMNPYLISNQIPSQILVQPEYQFQQQKIEQQQQQQQQPQQQQPFLMYNPVQQQMLDNSYPMQQIQQSQEIQQLQQQQQKMNQQQKPLYFLELIKQQFENQFQLNQQQNQRKNDGADKNIQMNLIDLLQSQNIDNLDNQQKKKIKKSNIHNFSLLNCQIQNYFSFPLQFKNPQILASGRRPLFIFDNQNNIPSIPKLPKNLQYYYEIDDIKCSSNWKNAYSFNKEVDEHIKIVVQKYQAETSPIEEVYYITNKGCLDSKKNTKCQDIMIGRQSSINKESRNIIPNDIILSQQDRSISRIHAKIDISKCFGKRISEEFSTFLKGSLYNKKNLSLIKYLPMHIYKLIFDFTKKPKQLFIQDIGSIIGTFTKVFAREKQALKINQTYLIGQDNQFQITEMDHGQIPFDEEVSDKILPFLYRDVKKQRDEVKIHCPKELEEKANAQELQKTNSSEESQEVQYNMDVEQDCLSDTSRQNDNIKPQFPFLKITFVNQITKPQKNIFIPTLHKTEFKIGRAQENDIVIALNTISRKQCRIIYENNQWFLMDGDQNKSSANGTWLSLSSSTIKQSDEKQESEQIEIFNNSEIKISDTLLKIQIVNSKKP